MFAHHIKQGQSAADVVFVVFPRLFNAFAHGFQSGEMDASIKTMGFHHAVEAFAVADVDFIEWDLFSCQLRHALERLAVAVAEVIDDYGLVARSVEFN